VTFASIVLLFLSLSGLTVQGPAQPPPLLSRRYEDGAKVVYQMHGENDGSTYEIRLHSVVKQGADGRFVEEYSWSDGVSNGEPRPLAAASEGFRATVILEKGRAPFVLPDLSQTPDLVGPVLDLMTFYADLVLAMNAGELRDVGDRFLVPSPGVASWADGTRVLLGEDAVDFDLTLTAIDRSAGIATLHIKHVPPSEPKIRVPADWMRAPVRGAPNNWVQVRKSGDTYVASVGQETFDVLLRIRLSDGVMLSASMENPVITVERQCRDAGLRQCDEPHPGRIFRRIEMFLQP
jgi:hypothetical protein